MEPLYRPVRGGPVEAGRGGISGYHTGGRQPSLSSEHIGQYSGCFWVGGYKTFWTAHLWHAPRGCGSRTAEQENYRGYPRMSNEELAGYVDRALDENMQLLCIATETPPANSICACRGTPQGSRRPVSLAGQYVPLSSMRRCLRRTNCPGRHRNGMIPSFLWLMYTIGATHLGI
ncbi:MAG: hypothetical protein ACLR7U_11940 [Ruthenibacterium lactatiformans]